MNKFIYSSSSFLKNLKNKQCFNFISHNCKRSFSSPTATQNIWKLSTFQQGIINIVGITSLTSASIYLLGNYLKREISFMSLFRKKIKNSTVPPLETEYVERKDFENEIKYHLTSPPKNKYTVIYGNKGVGKSILMDQCAVGIKNAVKIHITSTQSRDDIVKLILNALKINSKEFSLSQLLNQMKELNKENIYPLIIFDIESGDTKNEEVVLSAVKSISKFLGKTCHCFIVLEEAASITTFGRDPVRETHIFIDELSIEEAKEFFKKNNYSITDEEMNYIFDNIGTNPSYLFDILKEVPTNYSLKEYVSKRLDETTSILVSFPLKSILKALKEYPEGVYPEYFNNQIEKGVDLSDKTQVGKIMNKQLNPIIYRSDTGKYHILSTAHKTALKSYHVITSK